ncbi:hypothetical protein [Aminobacter carboxidus]|uniref:Uncharacterized protein n=1 Tax=Aminobacter carboxidus TaxID=376165 RepID=A0A8E1WBY5_9HYPH|nr:MULTISPECIES: hypothetical protein [Aminobacter carboxidus group]MBB6464637.1 hypothetical protein [Aminobacter lissarensis]MBE1206853.1 hypothetical protein [Aminobacter carboxidus]
MIAKKDAAIGSGTRLPVQSLAALYPGKEIDHPPAQRHSQRSVFVG